MSAMDPVTVVEQAQLHKMVLSLWLASLAQYKEGRLSVLWAYQEHIFENLLGKLARLSSSELGITC